jgi:hypothetical protein
MRFEPKTEDQLKAETLLPDGDYDFEVMDAQDTTSKKGNDMIAVKLRVFTNNGERHIYDYLMPSMGFKLRHFCESTGLLSKYDAGTLEAAHCIRREGIASIEQEAGNNGYGPKNKVVDYVVKQKDIKRPTEPAVRQAPPPPADVADVDVPF